TENGTYTQVVDRSGNKTPGTVASPIIDTFSNIDARYVKITVTGAATYTESWVSLLEMRVFAGEGSSQTVPVTGLSMTPSNASLTTGGTQQLSSSVTPSNASNQGVSYSSNNTSVAVVNSGGVVTAIGEGNAIITGTTDDGGFTDTMVVTVTDPSPSPDINLALNKSISGTGIADGTNVVANLVDGFTSTRWAVSGFPQTATIDLDSIYTLGRTELVCYFDRDYQYTVSVSSTENGTYTQVVDRSGNTTPGTVASPIIDTFSDIDARYVKITVTGAATYTESWVSLLEMRVFEGEGGSQTIPVTGLSMTPSSVSLTTGGTQQLSSSVTPSNASNQDVSYSSNNTSVAVVNSSGVVTAIGEGSATITGTTDDGGFTDTMVVTVTDPSPSPDINLALNKSISGTGIADGTNVVANLVDGFTSTRWAVSGFPQTATIDLDSIYTLGRTELVCYFDRDYQYTVSVSRTENGTYTQVVDRSGNKTPGTIASPIIDIFSDIDARYVKITVTGAATYTGSWISLLEMRVFEGEGGSQTVPVTGLSMTPSSASLAIGETQQLSSSVVPSNASNQDVSYSSNNTSVATVNSSGGVTAIREGSAIITGTTDDGGFTDTMVVTVTDPSPSPDINLALNKSISGTGTAEVGNVVANLVDGFTSTRWAIDGFPQTATIDLDSIYTLGRTELVCYADRAYQYTVSVSSTENGPYTQVIDRSENTTPGTIASPIIDTFSDIDARYVKITVTGANSYVGTWISLLEMRVFAGEGGSQTVPVTGVSMTPSSASLTIGETQQLSSSVAPSNASNQGVSYNSSNTSVAVVNSSGVVTAIGEGSATITGTTDDGGFTDTIVVTVTDTSIDTNLALNKSISGTGTVDGTNVVANLVDGATSTRWSVSGFPQTATIDLGSVYTLGRTELVCYADRDYQYTVSVSSTANGTYTQVVNRSGNTTPGTVANPIIDYFSDIDARYVKVTVTGANSYIGEWVSLLEMRVFAGNGSSPTVPVTGVSITPSSVSLTTGETQQLSSLVAPSNASNQGVSYSSSNTSVAVVNSSGVVTAIGEGSATITGTTNDGSFTDSSVVTVNSSGGGDYDAPYDIPKLQDYLAQCKLQSPGSGTEATASNIISGYSSNTFYVVDGDKVAFYQTGASARTELRFLDNWYVNNINKTFHANVKIVQQTCDQLTIMQIHDDANAGNGPNKPLLRVYKSTTKSPVNHLWAAIKTDSGGIATEHIDLGLAPSDYFDCDISIESGNMIIEINGSEEVNKDVSFWTFPSYWKNGVYLQDSGEAITYFNELTLSNSSTSKSSTTKTMSAFTLEEEVEVSLWPNPVIDTVNISGVKDFHTLIVYDLLGNLIISRAIHGESVDVSNLNSGLYIFRLLGKEKTINKRVIKK
ncbi:Ig-like domain-containing protein, partial [Flavivirga jejuensis]